MDLFAVSAAVATGLLNLALNCLIYRRLENLDQRTYNHEGRLKSLEART